MQPIPIPKINSRHPRPPPSIIMQIIPFHSLDPKVAQGLRTFFAKSEINIGVAVAVVELEIGRGFVARPGVDERVADGRDVPAAEGDGAWGLVVHGCS